MGTALEDQPVAKKVKLTGWELYEDVFKSSKRIVGPMVDQSELPWRILSRRYGANVAYTPMINVGVFVRGGKKNVARAIFIPELKEDGGPADRPLIVQFAGDDPEKLLEAAKMVENYCDAVDINFGCPQDIARRGHYGAFLCDEWDLIYRLINILHTNLTVPVTAKFRVFNDVEKTIKYAQMMEKAGAQILTCHGRTRDQRGQNAGLADWTQIRAVKNAVKVPVFANGNVLYSEDIDRCLEFTGADAYMSAEPQLHNPTIFLDPKSVSASCPPFRSHASLALEYLEIVESLDTPTNPSSVKGHLFKLMQPGLSKETDLRDRLGKLNSKGAEMIAGYRKICEEMKGRMERDAKESGWDPHSPEAYEFDIDEKTGLKKIPHWLAQPYVRQPKPQPSGQPMKTSQKDVALANEGAVVYSEQEKEVLKARSIIPRQDDVEETKNDLLSQETSELKRKLDGTENLDSQGDQKRPRVSE
ncbi:hypothetical protein FRC02_007340 [Tulasnella sp. 418]|nr:hypothetical protein FRC02_007340 [Tulasnella sp. 418]